jgi:hypothetical protein
MNPKAKNQYEIYYPGQSTNYVKKRRKIAISPERARPPDSLVQSKMSSI